jgi:1-acyl-sn-glycerol-3-phosphate acyltransferase
MVDEIMYSLMELSGQEYVDRYATSIKDQEPPPSREALKAS